jgi:hypothetical protein
MRNQLKKDPLGQAIKKCGLTVGGVSLAVLLSAGSAVADECDVIYGVHDDKVNDSQFVTIDPVTYEIKLLGLLHEGKDFEGLDINSDGSQLIASSGDDPDEPLKNAGVLYQVYIDTGKTDRIGQICFMFRGEKICGTEFSSLSFNPANDSLWGWSEECGLVEVNMTDPDLSKLVLPYSTDKFEACLATTNDELTEEQQVKKWQRYTSYVEDMTWDNKGEVIYVAYNEGPQKVILAYRPDAPDNDPNKLKVVNHEPIHGNVEAVEMLPDGETLLLKVHGSRSIKALDLNTGTVNTVNSDVGPYTDIEAVAACANTDDGIDGSNGNDDGTPDDSTPDDGNTPSGPTSTTITLDDGSSYEVSLENHVDNTWTYRVKEVKGKDLSHWVLGVGNCAKVLLNQTPANTEFGGLGPDGSTGFYGIKWDTGDKFSDALFSFTLDDDYPEATIDVLAKAGSKKSGAGHALGQILGPDCGEPGGFSGSSDGGDSESSDSGDNDNDTGGKGNGKGNGKGKD